MADTPTITIEPNTDVHGERRHRTLSGMHFGVCRTVDEVTSAWNLVHEAYVKRGLIDPNPYGIHTTPCAVGPQTVVVQGCIENVTVCTLSCILDNAQGLPLDQVYQGHLDRFRHRGHRLLEMGLFADRREQLSHSLDALFQMMRYVFCIGLTTGHDFGVIGVHPRHVPFYTKYFDFDLFGEETTYPTVRNNPVVPLCLDLKTKLQQSYRSKGLDFLQQNPLPQGFQDGRFSFDHATLSSSIIGEYLTWKHPSMPPLAQSA